MSLARPRPSGLTLEDIKQGIEANASELYNGRQDLYVEAEAQRDMPVTWTHYDKQGNIEWRKTMSSQAYKLWRMRGFK